LLGTSLVAIALSYGVFGRQSNRSRNAEWRA
jgi:hypothetical protein